MEMIMNILQMSIPASVLIISIFIIRAIALNKIPKTTFLILWGIALARLLIPVSISSQFSIYTVVNHFLKSHENISIPTTTNTVPTDYFAKETVVPVQQIEPTLQSQLSEIPAATIVWFTGAFILLMFFIIIHIRNYKELRFSWPVSEDDFFTDWRKKHKSIRSIAILQSDRITTPLAVGLIKPRIILPHSINMKDKQLLQYVLTHEYYHIRRFDALIKILLMFALCTHWFNPLVWFMLVFVNRDLELTCDEMVVRHFGADVKTAYAYSLIHMAEQQSKLTPLYSGFSKNVAEERVKSIMKIKKASFASIIIACLLLIGVTTAFATSAVVEEENKNIESDAPESIGKRKIFIPVRNDLHSGNEQKNLKSQEDNPTESITDDEDVPENTAKIIKDSQPEMSVTLERQLSNPVNTNIPIANQKKEQPFEGNSADPLIHVAEQETVAEDPANLEFSNALTDSEPPVFSIIEAGINIDSIESIPDIILYESIGEDVNSLLENKLHVIEEIQKNNDASFELIPPVYSEILTEDE